MTDAEKILKLESLLKPFSDFTNGGKAWKDTAWDGKRLSEAVLVDHKTGRAVTLEHFYRAWRYFDKQSST